MQLGNVQNLSKNCLELAYASNTQGKFKFLGKETDELIDLFKVVNRNLLKLMNPSIPLNDLMKLLHVHWQLDSIIPYQEIETVN